MRGTAQTRRDEAQAAPGGTPALEVEVVAPLQAPWMRILGLILSNQTSGSLVRGYARSIGGSTRCFFCCSSPLQSCCRTCERGESSKPVSEAKKRFPKVLLGLFMIPMEPISWGKLYIYMSITGCAP